MNRRFATLVRPRSGRGVRGEAPRNTERAYTASLPRHVIETFEQYLACGDLARGFVRCHGGGCGHDVLVAFSCKHSDLCPSQVTVHTGRPGDRSDRDLG